MKLLTQELRKEFPKMYATEKVPVEDKRVIAKFFTPDSNWTWYAVEFDGEDTFFGLVDGFEREWGYFSLSELQSVRGKLGLGVERDLYFGQPLIKEIAGLNEGGK